MDRQSPRSLIELESEITELAGHLNAAHYRWLTLIAEFDRRNGWAEGGCLSCAHWLNFKCGVAMGAAREKVRVARALEQLPKLAAAMGRGEVSYSKARAITRIASAENEEYLLSIALHGTAHHVERLVQGYRRAKDAEEASREARQFAGRSVRYFYDADGAMVLKAHLPADLGALLIKALDAAAEEISTPGVPAGTCVANVEPKEPPDERPTRAARRAAERRPQDPKHPSGAPPCIECPGSRLPVSRLHPYALRGCASRAPLGARWGDEGVQPRNAMSLPSSQGA